ncbi:MAG: DUF2470 domain-containing protein [Pseudonocardia sp.]|nr:DUF2470 domain-containing protein [Pseudonocardia sp.]
MGSTRLRRPHAPSNAERARSIASRGGQAALVGLDQAQRVTPLLHHVDSDGATTLLLPSDHELLDLVREGPRSGLPAMLEIADTAPVVLREPVRALLWITGWLVAPGPSYARRLALDVAEQHPRPALLDLGHGASLLRLRPGSAVIADAEGTGPLTPSELAAASPDPFCRLEHGWLRHLEDAHPDVFDSLARHLPDPLRHKPGFRIRPLGVDRLGIRLRVEADDGDHDVRLAFGSSAVTADQLRVQFGLLVGCRFRATGRAD